MTLCGNGNGLLTFDLNGMQTKEETEHKKTLEEVNQLLLSNILPQHVTDHYIQNANATEEVCSVCVLCV